MHPLAIALSGISGCLAVLSFCAIAVPPMSMGEGADGRFGEFNFGEVGFG